MNDLEDLIDQIVHGRGRIKPALEALLYILQKEFGEEFTQSIASCDLNESDAI